VAFRMPPGRVRAALAAMARSDLVAAVEADWRVTAAGVAPNDELWPQQWGPAKVGAPDAWTLTTGSPDVVIAVLDTGVNPHPDLDGALLSGRNILAGNGDTSDRNGHGTAAAGVAAARGHNRIGMAGMCWTCKVLPVKVLDDDGSGRLSDAAAGIVWATDRGAAVINMSFGAPGSNSTLTQALAYAADRGVVLVGAAGNAGTTTKFYPAASERVIAVGGSTSSDGRYSWSNHSDWVDVAAPGCNMGTTAGGGYGTFCGTSAAAPLVAGLAGLARAGAPNASADAVRGAIETNTAPLTWVRHGRVRAGAALTTLTAGNGSGPAPDPVPDPDAVDPDPVDRDDPAPEPDDDAQAACPAGVVPPAGFTDTAGSTHQAAIDCVVWRGIARGTSAGTFTPAGIVRRDQLASFLARLLTTAGVALPAATDQGFTDLAGNPHRDAINQLAALGVVNGRSAGEYGPAEPVRRDQMAALLYRAHAIAAGTPLPAAGERFGDIAGSVHRDAINKAVEAGFTRGTTPTTYSPSDTVRRDQMASFLARLLDLV
jgi:hypothetical protein